MSFPPDAPPVTPVPVHGNGNGNGHGPFDGSFDGSSGGPFTTWPSGKRPWYRRWVLWVVVAVVVIAASVVSDLPEPQSLKAQATVAAGVTKEIATGVHPCAYAASQSFSIYRGYTNGTFPRADRHFVPQYLREDQQACSFESTSIFGMSTITVPSSPAGDHLDALLKTVLEWATSDANGAIVAIQTLVQSPRDATALHELHVREQALAAERAAAERDLRAAERDFHGAPLPNIGLPSFPHTS